DHVIISIEHFKMPYVPLVYVEVAFSKGLLRKITRILREPRRVTSLHEADTAIFYSLNTTMPGLEGIALGAKMIVKASEYIARMYPHITHFATLSPIPGFRDYLTAVLGGASKYSLTVRKINANKHGRFISTAQMQALQRELGDRGAETVSLSSVLKPLLENNSWHTTPGLRKAMRYPLTEITRYYLTREKRTDPKSKERSFAALDPVTNFHLSNGASVGSINYMANPTARGMSESFGMMVNYLYDGSMLEKNKRRYRAGEVVSRC
ncbi:MAG: malonyl-CoA decarboxylase family protein, partial [Candidatus Aureabacteria bacterium]|nr:malonyl-CoA decarboxylase family protein [Candidatus Auribacterota bacterium]